MRRPEWKALVVEDEPVARAGLVALLSDRGDFLEVDACGDAEEALHRIPATQPDVLLLDVEMPGMVVFDLIEQLREPRPSIVFVTAHEEFALRAFDFRAADYVLKPFRDARIHEAIDRALQDRRRELQAPPPLLIRVRIADRSIIVRDDEIDLIEASGYYALIHVGAKTLLHRESLSSLARRLDPARFIRVHRSTIIAVKNIRELRRAGGGALTVVLSDGRRVPTSRRYRAVLEARFDSRSI
ncbi:MAG: LytTR family DNA-binding domain-containing protein [Candidatus Eisenbacteria bacterium]